MVGKEKVTKPNTNTYFGRMQVFVEALCKGKTKDEQIKFIKHELADSMTQRRMSLDGWGKTLKEWGFWNKISLIHLLAAFLLGICWGIILFT
ncbi:hypothetical protein LCGC14_0442200 [marine sediment metagenome]|uniref:Uncharacterized protein n=1 Tax=marine sediment metagenome TaxID=412755 RepID=A0A0F9SK41_9ZZZZ